MRFQELRDVQGNILARGLHPAVAVVACTPSAREAAISAIELAGNGNDCKVIEPSHIGTELERRAAVAAEQHAAAVQEKKADISDAEQAVQDAAGAADEAARVAQVAADDLSRFENLANSLVRAQEVYENAVRADCVATRELAGALQEFDRALRERQEQANSLDPSPLTSGGMNSGGPASQPFFEWAMSRQVAVASAISESQAAVDQADEISQAARKASGEALVALKGADSALRAGLTLTSVLTPELGPGVPLPGIIAHYREQLSAAAVSSKAHEAEGRRMQLAAETQLRVSQGELDDLVTAGPRVEDPVSTIQNWLNETTVSVDDVVFANEALERFDEEGVATLVESLASRGCQVIYLTDDPEISVGRSDYLTGLAGPARWLAFMRNGAFS